MTDLGQVVTSLIETLSISADLPSQLTVDFSWKVGMDALVWLDAQTVYPQCYWQARDGEEEVVALGQVNTFTCPIQAEKSLRDSQRIWGGNAFDANASVVCDEAFPSSYFFLPQIELTRHGNQGTLVLNIGDDLVNMQRLLSQLTVSNQCFCAPICRILSTLHQPQYANWEAMVDSALVEIEQTELQKVVLARKSTLALDRSISGAQLLKASTELNTGNFHFLLAIDDSHSFVGSTPERLFFRQELAMSTEALAGTIGRSLSRNEDMHLAQWLLNDDKNGHENSLVVDDISARLAPFCHQLNVEEKPHLLRLRSVQHLKRDISGCLHQGTSSANLLNALHPTAAIAGLPRDIASDFIKRHEPFNRGWYSGTVGYLSRARSEFCVAIRSALVMGDALHLFAGAGIVPGSVPIHEWDELDRKMATLMTLLSPFYDADMMEQKVG